MNESGKARVKSSTKRTVPAVIVRTAEVLKPTEIMHMLIEAEFYRKVDLQRSRKGNWIVSRWFRRDSKKLSFN